MKLKCDEPLSNVAFSFNVRRYIEDAVTRFEARATASGPGSVVAYLQALGKAAQVGSIKTRVQSAYGFSA